MGDPEDSFYARPRTEIWFIVYSYFVMIGMKVVPTLSILTMNVILVKRLNNLRIRRLQTKMQKYESKSGKIQVRI